MKRHSLFLTVCLLALFTHAATWHVDDITSGSNSGTSEENAWTNFTSIAWASVSAGDSIVLHSGQYSGDLNIGASGTSNNPITIAVSGEVSLNGGAISFGTRNYVTVDGSLSGSYTRKTTIADAAYLDANIGLWVKNVQSPSSAASISGIYLSGPNTGITVRWVGITNVIRAEGYTGPFVSGGQSANGVMIKDGALENLLFEYMHVVDAEDDGFYSVESPMADTFAKVTVRYCVVDNSGDDPFEVNHGWDIHHNRVGPGKWWHGHGDGIQSVGSYFRIYNNVFFDQINANLRLQANQGEGAVTEHVYVYGNIFYNRDFESVGSENVSFLTYGNFPGVQVFTNLYWTNIYWINNTFARTADPGTTLAMSGRTNYLNISVSFSAINNLLWTTNKTINLDAFALGGPTNASVPLWVPYDVTVVTNVASGTARGMAVTGKDATYLSTYNWTNPPAFQSYSNDEYKLAANDTAALNRGVDLSGSAFAVNMPSLGTDMLGNPRTGTWDVGALEYTPPAGETNLVVWLRFEDDFSDEILEDSSQNGNHAYRFGRPGSAYPTNWPTRVAVSDTPGRTSATGYSGDFKWYADGWGLYGRSGDYGAITNLTRLSSLNKATVAVWTRYFSAKRIDEGNDYTADANATLISAGTSTGIPGSWDMGRFNANISQNNTRFLVMTNSSFTGGNNGRYVVEFPDRGYDNQGNTTNWHHYAVTWDNGSIVAYFDGAQITTATLHVTNLVVGYNGNVSMPFIGIGCNTHGGSPALEDEPGGEDYPNHGWLNGVMDEVMIYDRSLSASEVHNLFTDGRRATVGKVNVGTLIIGQ